MKSCSLRASLDAPGRVARRSNTAAYTPSSRLASDADLPRFLNVTLFSFGALLATLLIWGIFYTLIQLSNAQTISGELGIVLPVVLLGLGSVFVWYKKGTS